MFTDIFYYISWFNIVLFAIGLISVVGVAIFIERMLTLKKSEIDTNFLLIALRKSIRDGHIVEALKTCEESKGAVSSIIKAGLVKHTRSQKEIENAMELQGLIEISYLEKNCKILSLIAYIAPLIGLLGTVLGFIQAFSEMRLSGLVDISTSKIGEAMEFALVTTAAGLAVAIPAIIAYNYLVSLIDQVVLEIQTTSSEVVDLLVYGDEI